MAKRTRSDRVKEEHYAEFQRQLALDKFREERPQMWLQHTRLMKLVEVQEELTDEVFPPGSCFLHANTVTIQAFCIRKVTGVDLDTCQVTVEIYGDEELEQGIAVIPLETIEWFGFPAKAVPIGIHFEGFTGMRGQETPPPPAETQPKPA
jgi:hypothetical protein